MLRASYMRLMTAWEGLTDHLYISLFESNPEVKALFPVDMEAQRDKLTMMLATAVDLLSDRPAFESACRSCGHRHLAYGALPAHYPAVTKLMIQGLQGVDPSQVSREEVKAWEKLINLVVREMLIGSGQTTNALPQA